MSRLTMIHVLVIVRFMFRFTMLHVEIITPCAVEITQYALKRAEAPSPGRRPG